MSIRLLATLALCAACSTAIPQPETPDPPVGELDIHTRIEGVALEAPKTQVESRRMRLTIAGTHSTEELVTRFVSKAGLAGGTAVSHLSIDAIVIDNRRLRRCKADVVAQREQRLIDRTRTIPSYVETRKKRVLFYRDEDVWFPSTALVIERVEVPEEVVTYKRWDHGLRIELSNAECEPVANVDKQGSNIVRGRVYFPE